MYIPTVIEGGQDGGISREYDFIQPEQWIGGGSANVGGTSRGIYEERGI